MAIVRWAPRFPSWPSFEDFGWPEEITEGGMDIYETDEEVVVEAPVPGVPEEDIDVTIEGGVIRIKGGVEEKEEEEEGKNYYRQMARRSFYYTAALPSRGKWDEAEAEVENGVVTVRVPKREEEKPQKIKVTKK